MTLADLIKPLVWETSHQTTTPIHVAQSVFGKYSVHGGAWGNGLFPLNIPGVLASSWHESIEAAQAAAQADYAARILSAIDPDAIAALIKVEEALAPFDEIQKVREAVAWRQEDRCHPGWYYYGDTSQQLVPEGAEPLYAHPPTPPDSAGELDADLLFDAYKAILVLRRILDKQGLEMGAKAANEIADRIIKAHPEFPGLTILRASAKGEKL